MPAPASRDPSTIRCILCAGNIHRAIFHEFGVDVLECRRCGHVFSSYRADADYDGYWGDEISEDEPYYWNDAHARMYEDFLARYVRGRSGRHLDVGCGLGFFVKAMNGESGWESHGSEISPVAVRYANEKLGLSTVVAGRLEDAGFESGSFDLITMWDVIEHILAPDSLLGACRELLTDDGALFLHTPNARIQIPKARLKRIVKGMRPGVCYLEARDHVHIYTTSTIRRVLVRNGLSRVEFTHLHPIQSVSGGRSVIQRAVKNAWFETSRALASLSHGHLNLDNLFVIARQ